LAALGTVKAEICIGVFDEETTPEAAARRKVQEAGFDHFLASAALEKTGGDATRALELLAKGWKPDDGEAISMLPSLPPITPGGCPFAGSGAAPPPGHPPVAGAALEPRGAATHARVLGVGLQARLDKLLEEDPELCCPVSLVLFVEPVIASDGFMYDKASVQELIRNSMPSPMTREELKADFLPAKGRMSATAEFRKSRAAELLAFSEEVATSQPAMAEEAFERAAEYIEVLKMRGEGDMRLASRADTVRMRLKS